jgi:hypothetical protein
VDNEVTIRGVDFSGSGLVDIHGGKLGTAAASDTRVSDNRVTIENVTNLPASVVGGDAGNVDGWAEKADVTDNVVNITNSTLTGFRNVVGGQSGGYGTVAHNTVNVRDSSLSSIVYGGEGTNGSATQNIVDVRGSTITGIIYGGSAGQSATKNIVNVRDSTVLGGIHGGNGEIATDNIVTLTGAVTIGADGDLYGGYGYTDAFTGNTLNLRTRDRLTVGNFGNFEYLNFTLPASLAPNAALIEVVDNGQGSGYNKAIADNSKIALLLEGASVPPLPRLAAGDRIRLIDASAAFDGLSASGINASASATRGIAFRYDFDLFTENNILFAQLKSGPLNPQTETLPESQLGGSAFLNQGADFLSRLWPETVRAGQHLFAAASGGNLRHNTGSHVSVKGHSLIAGMTAGRQIEAGELHVGAFVEHGKGDYNTRNSFANAASVHGGGDTRYTGGGALLRLQWPETQGYRWRAEASARAGRVKLDFLARDLIDASTGVRAAYRSRAPYAGIHARLGRLQTLGEDSELELYAQYLWNRQGADRVTLSTGEPVKFHAVNSHRVQLGAQWRRALDKDAQVFLGLAWEHEFDGKAKADIYGYRMATPKMQGDTAIVETGLTINPAALKALTLDFALQGYAGKREGVTGSVRANYRF